MDIITYRVCLQAVSSVRHTDFEMTTVVLLLLALTHSGSGATCDGVYYCKQCFDNEICIECETGYTMCYNDLRKGNICCPNNCTSASLKDGIYPQSDTPYLVCDRCMNGYFGDTNQNLCGKDCARCNKVTSSCTNCLPKTSENSCKHCALGRYGDDCYLCLQKCAENKCNPVNGKYLLVNQDIMEITVISHVLNTVRLCLVTRMMEPALVYVNVVGMEKSVKNSVQVTVKMIPVILSQDLVKEVVKMKIHMELNVRTFVMIHATKISAIKTEVVWRVKVDFFAKTVTTLVQPPVLIQSATEAMELV